LRPEPPAWLGRALGSWLWLRKRVPRPVSLAYLACIEAVYRVSIGARLFP
jgi:hypothetical protein